MSRSVRVEADGGSRGNPGPAGYGAVVRDAVTGAVLAERKEALGVVTNNVAEYRGLIAGLTAATELAADIVDVRMDSKLVVEQMSGRWQVKHPAMRPLAREAAALASGFREISYSWIPRAENGHADRLANEAMDAAAGKPVKKAATVADNALSETPKPVGSWLPVTSVPTRLTMVRHGVTEYSVKKLFAGRSDLDLTAEGVGQADRAATRVLAMGQVHRVISSPLLRTRHTAEIIAGRLGLAVTTDDDLMETDFGDWDGLSYAQVSERWPDAMQQWLADPAVAPPGGESFQTVTRRVRRARDRILVGAPEENVLVVSHVTPIKVLVRLALDAPPLALHRMYLQPASISVLDYFADGNCALRSLNENAHLE